MSGPPPLPGVEHEWVDAGGLRTHVALAGPADAPPLMLVHGWPQNWWEWRGLIGPLAEDHRVICPDLRGHGWTDAPPDGYEKEQLASDLLALLDALGVERTTWVGHDWGAWTGMLAALRAPERFERLLATSVPHLWSSRGDPRRLLLLGYQGPISTPGLGTAIVRGGFCGFILRRARVRGRYTDEDIEVFDGPLRARPHVTVAMYRTFLTREVRPLLAGRYATKRLEVPTTLLVGGRDLVTRGLRPGPVDGQPNLDVDVVEGVGHFLVEEAPEAVLSALSAG